MASIYESFSIQSLNEGAPHFKGSMIVRYMLKFVEIYEYIL